MLLSQESMANWIETYEKSGLVPTGLKTFIYLQQRGESLDFSEVIAWLKPQQFYVNRIERLYVIFDIYGSWHIIIERVNPPESPIAHIVIDNYEGYADYDKWDLRGFLRMAQEMIIDKCALPNPPWRID
jgi:hypothetical protein